MARTSLRCAPLVVLSLARPRTAAMVHAASQTPHSIGLPPPDGKSLYALYQRDGFSIFSDAAWMPVPLKGCYSDCTQISEAQYLTPDDAKRLNSTPSSHLPSASSSHTPEPDSCSINSYDYFYAQLSRILGCDDETSEVFPENTTTSAARDVSPAPVDDAMDVDDNPARSTTVALFDALPNVVDPTPTPRLTIVIPATKRKVAEKAGIPPPVENTSGRYDVKPIPSVTCRWKVFDPVTQKIRECGKAINLHERGINANSIINAHIINDLNHIHPPDVDQKWVCQWPTESKAKCGCSIMKNSIGKHITRGEHVFHEKWAQTDCPVSGCGKSFAERAGTDIESVRRHCRTDHAKESKVLFPEKSKAAKLKAKGKGKAKAAAKAKMLDEQKENVGEGGAVRPRRASLRQQRAGSIHPY